MTKTGKYDYNFKHTKKKNEGGAEGKICELKS